MSTNLDPETLNQLGALALSMVREDEDYPVAPGVVSVPADVLLELVRLAQAILNKNSPAG